MKAHLDEMQRKLDALQIGDKEGADAVPPVRQMEEQAREPGPQVAGEESLDACAFVDREREPEQHAPVVRRMRFRFEEDMA
jgi:hypothetical protein